jgi:16S rRNA (guanine1516-N2)-methyltransferase
VHFAVTTALGSSPEERVRGRAAAARHGLPFLTRSKGALATLAREAGADALLVLGRHASLFFGGVEHRWHPGMGALRAKRLASGESSTRDPFLEAAGLRSGDAILDCTLGLGADALVAATAVGLAGRIVGLEAAPLLAAWVEEGLRRLPGAAAGRIEVRAAEHGAFLAACSERSFDVVVFDPMFRHARAQAPAFELVRRLAERRPLSPEALARARRVARRWVVVKDSAPGWDLARLGLAPLPGARWAKRLYARVGPA